MTSSIKNVWLIGAGQMAQDYANVLLHQDINLTVYGRSKSRCEEFRHATGVQAIPGGIESISVVNPPDYAIVAVNIELLYTTTLYLLSIGCRKILVEKPGSLYHHELLALQDNARQCNAEIYIGYNRRFYASTQRLRELISIDGGLTSLSFEFTEWSHTLLDLVKGPGVMSRWLLSNSSHVLDLAFYLIGLPSSNNWSSWSSGHLPWHPASSCFCGAGISVKNVPFSYKSDWSSAGRWGIEACTLKARYILSPMEHLKSIPLGSVTPNNLPLSDNLDKEFKPGLYLQIRDFLSDTTDNLCSLEYQIQALQVYCQIGGYQLND